MKLFAFILSAVAFGALASCGSAADVSEPVVPSISLPDADK